jgi:hypothetical protein
MNCFHVVRRVPVVVPALLGVLVACGVARAAPVEWTPASGGDGHFYERIDQINLTFDQARTAAAALNFGGVPGHLAIFETPTYSSELAFVNTNVYAPGVQSSRMYWVGASSPSGNSGTYTWVDGTAVPQSISDQWNIDHFEGAGTEGIGFFVPNSTLWDYIATNSSSAMSGYVVEYDVPEPASASLVGAAMAAAAVVSRRRSCSSDGSHQQ